MQLLNFHLSKQFSVPGEWSVWCHHMILCPLGPGWIQPVDGVGGRPDVRRVSLGRLALFAHTTQLTTSLNQRPCLPATGRPMWQVTGISHFQFKWWLSLPPFAKPRRVIKSCWLNPPQITCIECGVCFLLNGCDLCISLMGLLSISVVASLCLPFSPLHLTRERVSLTPLHLSSSGANRTQLQEQ